MDSAGLRDKALRLLARREHTRHELRQKLAPQSESEAELDSVLDGLIQEGLLSDGRAAEAILRTYQGRQGPLKIQQQLKARGVPQPLANEMLQQARGREMDVARAVWQKKFSQLPASPEERARQGRYLQNRGFSPDVIRRVLRGED
jgi:regulatory protein